MPNRERKRNRTDPAAYTSVEELLAEARSTIVRLTPTEARAALQDGALLVDIRSSDQRAFDGSLPGARVIPRNVLEWRLDPNSDHRDPGVARLDRQIILICDEGYQSSLAATTLQRFGLDAADVIGGVQAWRAQGLPLSAARSAENPRPRRAT